MFLEQITISISFSVRYLELELYSISLRGLFRALDAENAKAKYNDSTKKQKITLKNYLFILFSRNYVLHCVPKCQSLFYVSK